MDQAATAVNRGTSGAPRTSSWAAASLLCSMAICCPLMTIIGPLLGARGLIEIKATPGIGGRRMAIAGIIIGVVATLLWAIGGLYWHFNARLPMLRGPAEELRAGLNGDIGRFRAGFDGDGATAPNEEAAAFLSELSRRYGTFAGAAQDHATAAKATMTGPAAFRIRYILQFDRESVPAEAQFRTFAEARALPNPVFKWNWVRIIDPKRGDLVYPLSAGTEAAASSQPAAQP